MTKQQREQREQRLCYTCAVCGKSILSGQPQYAHKIANTKTNRAKYGSFIIDHPLNGAYVCSLACNHLVNIGYNKGACLELISQIAALELRKFKNGFTG